MRSILSYTINFDMEALKSTEEDYVKVKYTREQVKLINQISSVLGIIIQIPETTIKAIVWNALREWQLKNNKTIAEISEVPVDKRLNAVKEIFHLGNKILKSMLKDPKSKNEIILEIAFQKAFTYYLNHISQNF
ncbi:MAG: hypothetical protein ACFE9N_05095 [Promethearchaeota archaeon]